MLAHLAITKFREQHKLWACCLPDISSQLTPSKLYVAVSTKAEKCNDYGGQSTTECTGGLTESHDKTKTERVNAINMANTSSFTRLRPDFISRQTEDKVNRHKNILKTLLRFISYYSLHVSNVKGHHQVAYTG
jgi:hypothetical protein